MDFSLPPEIEDYRQRVRYFVEREILPVEADRANWDEHENIGPAALERLRAKAKAEGLWSLQMPKEVAGVVVTHGPDAGLRVPLGSAQCRLRPQDRFWVRIRTAGLCADALIPRAEKVDR